MPLVVKNFVTFEVNSLLRRPHHFLGKLYGKEVSIRLQQETPTFTFSNYLISKIWPYKGLARTYAHTCNDEYDPLPILFIALLPFYLHVRLRPTRRLGPRC